MPVPLAQMAEGLGGAITELASQGVLGILVVMLGWFANKAHTREVERADKAEAALLDRVLPLLEKALVTIEAARHERTAVRSSDSDERG